MNKEKKKVKGRVVAKYYLPGFLRMPLCYIDYNLLRVFNNGTFDENVIIIEYKNPEDNKKLREKFVNNSIYYKYSVGDEIEIYIVERRIFGKCIKKKIEIIFK